MQGFNHIAGGLCFTGIFASFHDINIYEKPAYLGIVVGMSLLPDVDHTKSLIGKAAYPLAKFLSVKFGHRTITHSLIFFLVVVGTVNGIEWFYLRSASHTLTILTAYALLSHLIFDMCTRQGIPLFYPISTRPCVLPANPELRLRTHDFKSEAIVFILFCGLNLCSFDLMANGFWATYNQKFLNFDHIQREAKRKGDLLEIRFLHQKDTLKGMMIAETETSFVLATMHQKKAEFRNFTMKECQFLDFKHTGLKLNRRTVQVFGVSKDSIAFWLQKPLLKMQLQCNADMNYFEGAVLKISKSIEKDYIRGFDFYVDKKDLTEEKQAISQINVDIEAKENQHRAEANRAMNELNFYKNSLNDGNRAYARMTDYEKGRWIRESKDLENQIKAAQRELDRIPPLDLQSEYTRLDGLRKNLQLEEIKLSGNFIVAEFLE